MLTIHLSDFWTIGHNRGLTEGTRITLNWRKVGNLVCLSIRSVDSAAAAWGGAGR